MFRYKGYSADVRLIVNERGEKVLSGQVIDIKDTITFEARRIGAIEREFRKAVDEYLKFCEDLGQEPNQPTTQQTPDQASYPFRTSPENRHFIQKAAARAHTSVNDWIEQALPSTSDSVQYFLDEPSELDKLLGKILPHLSKDGIDSSMELLYALEKLLSGMDAMRDFLSYRDYEAFAKVVTEIETALKNIPALDERLADKSHHSNDSATLDR